MKEVKMFRIYVEVLYYGQEASQLELQFEYESAALKAYDALVNIEELYSVTRIVTKLW